jgi:hypothetical protein
MPSIAPDAPTKMAHSRLCTYALDRERLNDNNVTKVRLFYESGAARAYCADGYTYLIDPIAVLLKEAERAKGYRSLRRA